VDGAIVVGGYNSARLAGNFTEFPLQQLDPKNACPLQVTVADVLYSFPNKTTKSLFTDGASNRMIACIEPFQQRFTFPEAVLDVFETLTGHDRSFHSGLTYPVAQRPLGDLTVKLDNGYTSTIPNYELVTKLRGSDEYGRYSIVNDSIVEVGIAFNVINNTNVVPILGGLFLTMNYLFVDYEMGLFKLAPATQDAQDGSSEMLIAQCKKQAKSKSNVGVIVGSVIGGIAGLALIAGAIFFYIRSRRRHKEPRLPPPPSTEVNDNVACLFLPIESATNCANTMRNRSSTLKNSQAQPSPIATQFCHIRSLRRYPCRNLKGYNQFRRYAKYQRRTMHQYTNWATRDMIETFLIG